MQFIIYAVICAVYFVPVLTLEHNSDGHLERSKRQEDRWSWGHLDMKTPIKYKENLVQTTTTTTTTTKTTTTTPKPNETQYNPCDPYEPTMPNIDLSGKRISEKKCLEYMWHVKYRDLKEKRSTECLNYRRTHSSPNGPHFAIGGRPALPGEYPHMGAIGWKAAVGSWIFKCGSSLISSKFVLTAGHCIAASPRDTTITDVIPKIVRLGDKNIIDVWSKGQMPRDFNITRIIRHPKYDPPKKYYDIALMELEEDVTFSLYVQPACLWTKPDTSSLGKTATLTGWGVVETLNKQTSPDLQAAVVDILDTKMCDGLLRTSCNRHWCGFQEHQLCAGKLAGGVDACQGDSGGPLQVQIPLPITSQGLMHYVIGVTSFGVGCALPNLPGIYTRVSSFVDWIEPIVWPDA